MTVIDLIIRSVIGSAVLTFLGCSAVAPRSKTGTPSAAMGEPHERQLASRDSVVATRAVEEAFEAGTLSFDWLFECQGDSRPYYGRPFGRAGSGTAILYPEDPASGEWPISVEVACLYIIQAIFEGTAEHASSMLLSDLQLAPRDGLARNTPALVSRAWTDVREWKAEFLQYGLDTMRTRSSSPLRSVGFW